MWQGTECTLVRGEDEESVAYEIWLAPGSVRQLWDALLAAGAAPVGSEALELQRIVSGIPRYGVDIRERDLPQETEQARALNFNKGCYVGQEIVERIRSRGAVHRKFTGFVADGRLQIAAGTKIVAGEKEVGEITSAASVQLPVGTRRSRWDTSGGKSACRDARLCLAPQGRPWCSCRSGTACCYRKRDRWNSIRRDQNKF